MNIKEELKEITARWEDALGVIGDPEISAEKKEQAKRLIDEELRPRKAELFELADLEKERDELNALVTKEAREDEREAKRRNAPSPVEFENFRHFLKAAFDHSVGRYTDDRLRWFDESNNRVLRQKDMAEGSGAAGGYLVPTEFRAELYALMAEESFVRNRATIIPMTRRAISIPVLDQTNTTSGVPAWYGGMQFYWTEEAAQKESTEPSFRKITLEAHKLVGYTRASDELLDDSAISLEAFLTGPQGFAGGVNWFEEYAFINGVGGGQPLGVLNAGCTITEPRAADGEVTYPDLVNMLQHFLPRGQGMWIISQSALAEIITLNGPSGNPSYVWQPNARDGVPGFLLGFPVVFSEKVPALGSAGDVILADWSYYLIGDRQQTTVESTKFDRWRYDQTSWRVVHRVDGQPWLSDPVTLQDGSSEISPFVILGEKSS